MEVKKGEEIEKELQREGITDKQANRQTGREEN